MKARKPVNFSESYLLRDENIDRASEDIFALLEETGMDRKNALRLRLSLEEILLTWQKQLGNDAQCCITARKHLGQMRLSLETQGMQYNPLEAADGDSYQKSILSGLGTIPTYRYSNGVNRINLQLPRKGISTPLGILIAIVSAIIAGLALLQLPANTLFFIGSGILQPLMNAFMRALSAIAGPLIFLSVVSGICNIGNKAALGKLGGRMIRDSLLVCLLFTLLPLLAARPKIQEFGSSMTGGLGAFTSLLEMVLGAIPATIIAPFADGNSLQIILIAVFAGLAILSINSRSSILKDFITETETAVQFIMSLISKLLPGFIFISVLDMILSGIFASVLEFYVLLVQMLACSLALFALYIIIICAKFRLSPGKLIKKLLPTFIIGITTASSAAAFSSNMETCEKQLGISRKLTGFGIPLGQVIYMPGVMFTFLLAALYVAEKAAVVTGIGWIIIAMFLAVALSAAAPPIPGGAMTCYTIIFTQLGLPMDYLPIILSLNVLLDFVCTGVNLSALQCQLVLTADKAGELNRDILLK